MKSCKPHHSFCGYRIVGLGPQSPFKASTHTFAEIMFPMFICRFGIGIIVGKTLIYIIIIFFVDSFDGIAHFIHL